MEQREVSGEGARAQLSVSSQKCQAVLGPQFPHLQHGGTSTYLVELCRLMS